MLQATQLVGFGAGAEEVVPFSATYINTNSSTANASTYDFGDFTFPTNGLAVVLVVANGAAGVRTISSLTVGGNAASLEVNSGDGPRTGGVASVAVVAGARNVTVNLSGTQGRCAVFVYLLAGLVSNTVSDFQDLHAPGGTPVTSLALNSVTIPAGGVGLYACLHANTNAHTWTNATEQTGADYSVEATDQVSSALALVAATVTPSWTTSAAAVAVGASWA
jgi:hypothetical protein